MDAIRQELLVLCFTERQEEEDSTEFEFLCIINIAEKALNDIDNKEVVLDAVVEIQNVLNSINV